MLRRADEHVKSLGSTGLKSEGWQQSQMSNRVWEKVGKENNPDPKFGIGRGNHQAFVQRRNRFWRLAGEGVRLGPVLRECGIAFARAPAFIEPVRRNSEFGSGRFGIGAELHAALERSIGLTERETRHE